MPQKKSLRAQIMRVFVLAANATLAEDYARSELKLRQGEGRWTYVRNADQIRGVQRGHAMFFAAPSYDPGHQHREIARYLNACDIPIFQRLLITDDESPERTDG